VAKSLGVRAGLSITSTDITFICVAKLLNN